MSIVAIEDALVARLVDKLQTPGLVRQVYGQSDYAAIQEAAMVTPSVAVIYSGYTPGEKTAQGAIQNIGFGWLVVVNVRNARDTATGAGVRADASPIFDAVLEALLGFRPLPKFTPLQLDPAPGAALTDAGFGYYPIAFTTSATYRGTPTT